MATGKGTAKEKVLSGKRKGNVEHFIKTTHVDLQLKFCWKCIIVALF